MSEMFRVLILGDGNFSFSRAYLKRILTEEKVDHKKVSVLATSYDSRQELLDKYREYVFIEDELLRFPNCTVQHNVNAANISQSFANISSTVSENKFDCIIFNFPHLGVEDLKLHSALLFHFFISAQEWLATDSSIPKQHCDISDLGEHALKPWMRGGIVVSLAYDQPERWEMVQEAAKAGLVARDVVPLNTADWPGYETKRHQVNRSFPADECRSFFFIPTVDEGLSIPTSTALVPIVSRRTVLCTECKRYFHTVQDLEKHQEAMHNESKSDMEEGSIWSCTDCDGRIFKDESALHYHRVTKHSASTSITPVAPSETPMQPQSKDDHEVESKIAAVICSSCQQEFSTQDLLQKHMTLFEPRKVAPPLECASCHPPRSFKDLRALNQHTLMKHTETEPPHKKHKAN